MIEKRNHGPVMAVLLLWVAWSPTGLLATDNDESGRFAPAEVLMGETGLWRTTNMGESWESIPTPAKGRIDSLTLDPTDQRRILLAQDGVVWLSNDNGRNWESPVFNSVEEQGIAAAFHPTRPETLFLATNQRLLISNNAGKDWTPVTPSLEFKWRPQSILVSAKIPDRLYVATRGHGVFRSDDGGQTWLQANTGLPKAIGAAPVAPIESAVLDQQDPEILYVAAEAMGIYKTTNGGTTWRRVGNGLPDRLPHRSQKWVLAVDPLQPRRLLLWAQWTVNSERTDSAFFLSEDGAGRWRKISAGPTQGRVFDVYFTRTEFGLAAAVTEDGIIFLSN